MLLVPSVAANSRTVSSPGDQVMAVGNTSVSGTPASCAVSCCRLASTSGGASLPNAPFAVAVALNCPAMPPGTASSMGVRRARSRPLNAASVRYS